ncbi:MAG: TonB-dependent receptor [Pseudomonadota bacterium]
MNAVADTVIDEIQVTATRRSSAVTAVPTPVTVIGQSQIDASSLLTDALAFAPGVMLQETTPGQGAAIVRGLKGSEVLHLVDGIRLNNAIFRSAPTQYVALVPGASVERLEVLRGSAAALYGSDAVGGVVNVITRQPQFSDDKYLFSGDVQLSLNSAEALRAAALTLELANENTAGLIGFDAMRSGDRRVGGGERIATSGFEAYGLRAALRQKISANNDWFADVQLMRQPSTPRVDELVPGFGETEPASAEFFFEPSQRSFVHTGANFTSGLLDADWQLRAAWQRIDDDRRTRNNGSSVRRIESNRSDLFHVGLTGSRGFSNGSFIAGLEWYHDEVASSRRTLDLLSGEQLGTQPRFPDGASLDQIALFTQFDWSLTDTQTVTAGIRLTDLTADTNNPLEPTVKNTDVSGELGWLMNLSPAISLAANVGRSFRAPNIFDLGVSGARPGNRFNVPNGNLKPETALQYDVGVRYASDRLSINATVFKLDYEDRISSVPTGEQTADGRDIVRNQNIARAEIVGLELDALINFSDTLSLLLVVNALRGTEYNPEQEPADRIPPINGQARLDWFWRESTQFSTGVTFAAEQDRLSARDIRDARINPLGTPGWVALNLGANHQLSQHWVLDARLENVLDKRFRNHGSGVDASGVNLSLQLHYSW